MEQMSFYINVVIFIIIAVVIWILILDAFTLEPSMRKTTQLSLQTRGLL